jgi:hypothetical protein
MIERCYDNNCEKYPRYGGRGIKVCDQWKTSFETFLKDVGLSPGKGYSIDRINNDGDYEPTNVKWSTRKEQQRNRHANHLITVDGQTKCLNAWADHYGVTPHLIHGRIKRGWDDVKAVTTPQYYVRKKKVTPDG